MTRTGLAGAVFGRLGGSMTATPQQPSDQGLELVRDLHKKLQVDPEWCVWDDRGFTWWGKNLAQRVWAEAPRQDEAGEAFQRLHAQTDMFDGFDGSDEQVQLLNIINHTGTLSALVPAGDGSGRVRLCCSMLLYPNNGDFARLVFDTAATLQAAEAVITTSWLGDEFRAGLTNAVSHHPVSGERLLADEMLEIVDLTIRPMGESASRYAGAAMDKLGKDLQQPPCIFASGSETGVSAEYPHPKQSYLLRLLTEEKHPRLGHGMLAMLHLPEGESNAETARAALSLNTREIESDQMPAHFLGSWCAGVAGLTYVSFYPNAMANDGLPVSVALNLARRARWHCENLHGFSWAENFNFCAERYLACLMELGLKKP
jgi:hypothetical protein